MDPVSRRFLIYVAFIAYSADRRPKNKPSRWWTDLRSHSNAKPLPVWEDGRGFFAGGWFEARGT